MSSKKTIDEIVGKAKQGDRSAFDLLYREYSERLLKYVIELGANADDAEKIVSETFLEAIDHIGELRVNAFFGTWLHSIAKHKLYKNAKNTDRHRRVDLSRQEDEQTNDGIDVAKGLSAEQDDVVMLPGDYIENEDTQKNTRQCYQFS